MTYLYDDDRNDDKREQGVVQAMRDGGKASAEGSVVMNSGAFQAFMTSCSSGASEVWEHARLAGILAAKQADELLLIQYTVNIAGVDITYRINEEDKRVMVRCEVRTRERIGAETSAIVGCGVALMVLVDSFRAIDKVMSVEGLRIQRDL